MRKSKFTDAKIAFVLCQAQEGTAIGEVCRKAGIPALVANHVPHGMNVQLHAGNGMLGLGPFPYEGEEDADLINAGKQTNTQLPTSSLFDSAQSFGMIRGGHIDRSMLGAPQLAAKGSLSRCMIPGQMVKGMGGAMDLLAGVKRVILLNSGARA